MLVIGIVASVWAIRQLGAPMWWLAFPPLVDGMWNANPHVVVLPLLLASLAPIAIVVKVYAAVVPLRPSRDPGAARRRRGDPRHCPLPSVGHLPRERELIQLRLDQTAGGGASVVRP